MRDILTKPLTVEEIYERKGNENYIDAIVPIPLSTIVQLNENQLEDWLSEAIVGKQGLRDVSYVITGHMDEYTLLLHVIADVDTFLARNE